MTVQPITPNECTEKIPDFVIEIFNRHIKRNFNGHDADVLLECIISEIRNTQAYEKLPPELKRTTEQMWLKIENIYSDAGWHVSYFSPDIGDDFKSYFTFVKKQ